MTTTPQDELGGLLRNARKQRNMTQVDLARLSGASVSSIKAYEKGSRRPRQKALNRLITGLGLSRHEANPILASAGFSVDLEGLFGGRWQTDLDALQELIESCPWPAFISGQGFNFVAANRAFQRVWDVNIATEYPNDQRRNFLAGASLERFASCAENYDELLAMMMGLVKGDPRLNQELERPAPWIREALQEFLDGDPKYIKPLLEAWEKAEPVPHHTRIHYEVRWRYRGQARIRFNAVLTIADIWNELSWNDWIPADRESWDVLQGILAVP
jgi:transcriptional regulator with XRE-family HTH domain